MSTHTNIICKFNSSSNPRLRKRLKTNINPKKTG